MFLRVVLWEIILSIFVAIVLFLFFFLLVLSVFPPSLHPCIPPRIRILAFRHPESGCAIDWWVVFGLGLGLVFEIGIGVSSVVEWCRV